MYLDTSALVKLVHPETETVALRRYLADRKQTPKFTSAVTLTELPRALRRANHDPANYDPASHDAASHDAASHDPAARETLRAETELASQLLGSLRIVEMTRAMLTDAASADGPLLRSLDAIHLTAGARLAIGLTAFVTYDKRLAVAAEEAGLPVVVPA